MDKKIKVFIITAFAAFALIAAYKIGHNGSLNIFDLWR